MSRRTSVDLLQERLPVFVKRSFVVCLMNREAVLLVPGPFPVNLDFPNLPLPFDIALLIDWNAQPLRALRCLYSVTVSPAMLIVLDIVIKDEKVRFLNLVKISSPWDVRGLQDHASHDYSVSTFRKSCRSNPIYKADSRSPLSRKPSRSTPST